MKIIKAEHGYCLDWDSSKENKKDPYPQAEYERLYEMYDQDTQCAVYDVMDLMSEIEEMYAILKELELLHLLPEKIRKQLKTKFDCLRETKPPGRINIFLDNKTK